ncbi:MULTISPECIES: DNA topoisomerase IB [Bradyrhizobium]|jgi:DNA topoisomerase-1|uniref:DNA topoisomerase IB n=1 Tax=Bradyrhizobium denitrificans TaxID=2734912 RepID=A0ABS5G0T2_9BRAD|nr:MULTISPECIES: DNA topoisomerase IB [Bradyrhizobium]RTM03638.1 MAG: DNA topoisomerase IB [Bradyrhizobiaceae bacterium]MBR1134887.1 DNA topoisomerase IB [Bradyrhizobium denitrificans]MCL8485637.1 DNA topoisomerase IB [Bradyrhizobium denitrificans]MDU0957733.1 DNA topoisomerase IB [Bradyrhizobium sp.]MDU1492335.1 DNA topoisomerase IB [Bradyrhizobium sp.]
MTDQQNFESSRVGPADAEVALAKALGQWPPKPPRRKLTLKDLAHTKAANAQANAKTSVEELAQRIGLKLGDQTELTIRRIKRGKSYSFIRANGTPIRHAGTIRRLHAMAVPPAYRDVRYAPDPSLHLQAVGIDAAGRLQYRYHADWEKVREHRKAHRLAKLVGALPRIRRAVSKHLAGDEPTREFALAAVIELIARTAIRPGNESYARLNGTRGATTLLKSNVILEDDGLVLTFKAKGGKAVRKECDAAKLVRAVGILRGLPGRRMFQYRDAQGVVRAVSTTQVNAFLREIAGIKISLKDFRTLMASAVALETLSRITPAASARGRKKQILEAIRAAADELTNTPAICRKSYVHDTIVTAFEDGILERFAATMKGQRSQTRREQLLAQVVMAVAA